MDVIREDRRLTVREVGDMLGIGKSSLQRILCDISMTSVCTRLVPRQLNENQMQSRASASREFLKTQRKDALFLKMDMTFNRHNDLRFDVLGVVPTVNIYH